MPPTEQDLFFYNGDGECIENLTKYCVGGLHPVNLSDVLPKTGTCISDEAKEPRYRVAQKLGHGGFSTVWLARDIQEERYVALKIGTGSSIINESNESKILRHICQIGPRKPGYSNIIELFDVFTIRGPNGFHECFVTEVVLPLHDISIPERCPSHKVTRQLLMGFNFLHNEGLVHGDPHYANFGIAIPQLQRLEEREIADFFADPTIIPVVPRDPSFPRDSIPSYVAESVSLESFIAQKQCFPPSEEVCVKILDFGRAFWANEPLKDLPGAAPPTVRPPEVYMNQLSNTKVGSVWSKEADIWAIGCMAYQIHTGSQLLTSYGNLQYQLYQALRLGGPPPEEWLSFWDLKAFCKTTESWKKPIHPFYTTDMACECRRPKGQDESGMFLSFIRKMVITEPTKRSTIPELLGHPYLQHI